MRHQSTYKNTNFRPSKKPECTPIFHSSSSGKEKDSETGYYYFGARYYNPNLSLWLSVDPMADKYPSLSPYNYCAWNPMKIVDPNGMEIGDYYTIDGKWVRSDKNTSDNKVYICDGVNENGDFINARDLGVSHNEFCTSANIVRQESSHASGEDLWIAHAANNAAKRSKVSLYQKLKSGYSSVSNKTPLSSSNSSANANSARAAIINVLTGGTDPTGGASLWDGTDFLAWGESQAKFSQYKSITITKDIYDTYLSNNLAKYPSGTVKYPQKNGNTKTYQIPAAVFTNQQNWNNNVFQYNTGSSKAYKSIVATGAVGRSVFWKIQ